MPEIEEKSDFDSNGENELSFHALIKYPHFVFAVVTQFMYVAAQTGVNSFFILYVTETIPRISNEKASRILAFGGMGLFFIGRFSGSQIMRWFRPNRILATYGTINVIAMILVVGGFGWASFIALFINYFCMSIMFPTIFALGIKGLGPLTKKASSLLVVPIVGGALCPILMGYIANVSAMRWGFIIPLVCFVIVAMYGYR